MSPTRLAAAALLCAVLATAAVRLPTEDAEPIRVRPGHARAVVPTAPVETPEAAHIEAPAFPIRLTADVSPADTAQAPEATPTPEAAPAEEPTAEPAEAPAATRRSLGSGIASYYGAELAGNPTASGERFDPSDLTAAHRTLPFGTKLDVTNPRTGQSVVVRVNDRGPFHRSRLIDLSKEAARRIGLVRTGTGRVEIAIVEG